MQKQKESYELISILNKYIKDIEKEDLNLLTHKALGLNFELFSLFYQLNKSYDEIINLSNNTLFLISEKPYDTHLNHFMIYIDMAYAFKCKEEYSLSLETIRKALDQHKNIDFNWFKLKSSEFNILMIQKRYNDTYTVLNECIVAQNNVSNEKIREEWNIKEAYVTFIAQLGYIDSDLLEKYPLKEFRLNRFLNDVPVYSKQKRSLNISILVIQMLFYLQIKNYNSFVDRMDAINLYTYRYLRNDDTLRSNCFIKMLLKIPDASYHPVALKRHVQKLYEKLTETPLPISDQTTDVEIIPYEDLWEMVLELLEKNR